MEFQAYILGEKKSMIYPPWVARSSNPLFPSSVFNFQYSQDYGSSQLIENRKGFSPGEGIRALHISNSQLSPSRPPCHVCILCVTVRQGFSEYLLSVQYWNYSKQPLPRPAPRHAMTIITIMSPMISEL